MEDQVYCKCPSCKKSIELDSDLTTGDVTYCPECFEGLKVINLSPFKVEISEEEESWDDNEGEKDYE